MTKEPLWRRTWPLAANPVFVESLPRHLSLLCRFIIQSAAGAGPLFAGLIDWLPNKYVKLSRSSRSFYANIYC